MKQFIINKDGTIKAFGAKKAPDVLYCEHDGDTLMVHFSETESVNPRQMKALGENLEKILAGKTAKRVKQRSKNCVGFSLEDSTDSDRIRTSNKEVVDILKSEALRIKQDIDGTQPNPDDSSKQPAPDNSAQPGSKQPTGNGSSKQPTGNGSSKQPTGNGSGKQPNPNGGKQPNPDGGSKQPSKGANQPDGGKQTEPEPKAFDKTLDMYGNPLKEAHPELFGEGMTDDQAYEWYWHMVGHIRKDVVPIPGQK